MKIQDASDFMHELQFSQSSSEMSLSPTKYKVGSSRMSDFIQGNLS